MSSINRPLSGGRVRGGTAQGTVKYEELNYEYRRVLGDYLRTIRKEAGLTQSELANELGVGFTAISAMEVGRNQIPPEHYETIARICGLEHVGWGKRLLRYTNPWIYALIYGKDDVLRAELTGINGDGGRPPN